MRLLPLLLAACTPSHTTLRPAGDGGSASDDGGTSVVLGDSTDGGAGDGGTTGDGGTPDDGGAGDGGAGDGGLGDGGAGDGGSGDGGSGDGGDDSAMVPDFELGDVNTSSPTFATTISPRDYLEQVSGWYFIHST